MKIKIGDLVDVPIADGEFVSGKVLYVSEHYKNLILLGLFSKSRTSSEVPDLMAYTGGQPIKRGRWRLAGNEPLSDKQENLALRIVAGHVWLNDECLRPVTEDDRKNLSHMRAEGVGVVENMARKLATE